MKGHWLNTCIQTQKRFHILFSVLSLKCPSTLSSKRALGFCSSSRTIDESGEEISSVIDGSNKGEQSKAIILIYGGWGKQIKNMGFPCTNLPPKGISRSAGIPNQKGSHKILVVQWLIYITKTFPHSKRIEEKDWDSSPISSWIKFVSFGMPSD